MGDLRQRCGRFSISSFLVDKDPEAVVVALEGCVVLRCEHHLWDATLHYTALHGDFDVVEKQNIAPIYECRLHRTFEGTVTREWVKQPAG